MRTKYPGLSFSAASLPEFSIAFEPVFDLESRRQIGVRAEPVGAAGEGAAKLAKPVPPLLLPALYQKIMFEAILQSDAARIVGRNAFLLIRLPVILAPEQVGLAFPARSAVAAGIEPANVLLEIESASLVTCDIMARFGHQDVAMPVLTALRGVSCLTAVSPGFRPVLKVQGCRRPEFAGKPFDRRALARFAQVCRFHGVTLIAEDVTSEAECLELLEARVNAMHGPLFAAGIPAAFSAPGANCAATSAA